MKKKFIIFCNTYLLLLSFVMNSYAFGKAVCNDINFSSLCFNNENEKDKKSYKQETGISYVFNYNDKLFITENDVNLMAKVVHAESRGEPYDGKVAVAAVILNRATSDGFPKTIEGVITQKNAFSCVVDGKINITPDENSYKAVLDAINGYDPTNNAIFFFNPKIATCPWMQGIQKQNVKIIGNHLFFQVKKN